LDVELNAVQTADVFRQLTQALGPRGVMTVAAFDVGALGKECLALGRAEQSQTGDPGRVVAAVAEATAGVLRRGRQLPAAFAGTGVEVSDVVGRVGEEIGRFGQGR